MRVSCDCFLRVRGIQGCFFGLERFQCGSVTRFEHFITDKGSGGVHESGVGSHCTADVFKSSGDL